MIKLIYLGKWLEKFERVYNNFKTNQSRKINGLRKQNKWKPKEETHTHTHIHIHLGTSSEVNRKSKLSGLKIDTNKSIIKLDMN